MLKGLKIILFLFAIKLTTALMFLSSTMAAEAICPGGISPDSNVIWCDDFEDGTWLDTWDVSSGYEPEYRQAVRCDNNSFGFQDKCSAYSGNLHFDGEWGYDNHYGDHRLPSTYTELYLRMYIYFSNPYSWGETGDKGIYFRNSSDSIEKIRMEYNRNGLGKPTIASYAISGEILFQNQGKDITFQPGKWYLVEFYVKLNDPGIANGIVKLWVNDASNPITSQTLRLYYNNLLIRKSTTNPSTGYDMVWLTNYHQACFSACPQILNQWVKWDNIVVSNKRIGPVGSTGITDGPPPAAPILHPPN